MVKHITDIFNFLNEYTDYVVLRNYEGLPENNDSRDIDIIISANSWKKNKKKLFSFIEDSGARIIVYYKSDRLQTLVCAIPQTEGKGFSIVQWDFFFNTSVFGIELMSAEEFLEHKKFNGKFYHTNIGTEFLDKYLYDRAVGAAYPEKYAKTKERAEFADVVTKNIRRIFACKSVKECDKTSKTKLLSSALWHNIIHHPLRTPYCIIKFIFYFIKNYFAGPGFSFSFSGPDGVGKTTIIEGVIEQLSPVFAKAHKYYHFRPTLFGNISNVAHSVGLKKTVDTNYDKPHRGTNQGTLSSFLRLLYYTFDYIIGYYVKVKPNLRITQLVIFDRYFTDIILDSRRSRIFLNYKFLYKFGRIFIPSLNYSILLTADKENILQRKQELTAEEIDFIQEKLHFLSSHKDYIMVNNNGTPEHAIYNILNAIFNKQHEKNIRK